MDNKRYKTAITSIVGLILVAGGLFAYQNIYVAKQQQADRAVIFLAKQDIKADTPVSADMFQGVYINKNSVAPGEVENINAVVGKKLKGGIFKGEQLFTQRLAASNSDNEGNLLLQINPDAGTTVQANDTVQVYVLLTNPNTNQSTEKFLYQKHVVSIAGSSGGSLLGGGSNNKLVPFNVEATQSDVENYYIAKQAGKIDVVTIAGLDVTPPSSDATNQFNANDPLVSESKQSNQSVTNGQSVVSYQVQQGDTLSSLALKFQTSNYKISSLNNGQTVFKPGQTINIPAN